MIHFCTYFDQSYLVRGLALHASLLRQRSDFTLWILCLTTECHEVLSSLRLPKVRLLHLEDLEAADPELAAVRASRSLFEYYMTCSPCLPRILFDKHPKIDSIHYLDADLYFFSDAAPVVQSFSRHSVAITPHRFAPSIAKKFSGFGNFNVGWISFRRDVEGQACLDWWRERCIEWCFFRLEPGRFGDQKYLDEFPRRFRGVQEIARKGVNLAPWNIVNYEISGSTDEVRVDDEPLICFHFSSIQKLATRLYRNNPHVRSRLTSQARALIYRPYLRELESIAGALSERALFYSPLQSVIKASGLRKSLRRAMDHASFLKALAHGNLIRT